MCIYYLRHNKFPLSGQLLVLNCYLKQKLGTFGYNRCLIYHSIFLNFQFITLAVQVITLYNDFIEALPRETRELVQNGANILSGRTDSRSGGTPLWIGQGPKGNQSGRSSSLATPKKEESLVRRPDSGDRWKSLGKSFRFPPVRASFTWHLFGAPKRYLTDPLRAQKSGGSSWTNWVNTFFFGHQASREITHKLWCLTCFVRFDICRSGRSE